MFSSRFILPVALGAATLFASSGAWAQSSNWTVDPAHSEVGFSVKHMMFTHVRGVFRKYDAKITLDDKDISKSSVDVTIDAASVDTSVADRDTHLRSPEFFNVEKNPNLTFKSTKIVKAGKDKLKVTGDLTINGVTKSVILAVDGPSAESKDPWGNIKRGVYATTTINRKDYKLVWNKALETGGVLVADEVKIELSLELQKPAPDKKS